MLRGLSRVSRLLLVFSCFSLLAGSAGASPILIDDFDASTVGDPIGVRSAMELEVGGVHFFPDCCTFDFVGPDGGILLTYSSIGGLDFSTSNDAIVLDILALVPMGGPIDLEVDVNDASTGNVSITAAGTVTLPYSTFSDPTQFQAVDKLDFKFTSGNSFAISVDTVEAILTPEPSTAVLMGMGLLGLTAVGRRQTA